jgi:hypothetical protein
MQSLTGTSRGMFRGHIARPRRAEFASVQGGIAEVARGQELRVQEVICRYYGPKEGKSVVPDVIYIHREPESYSIAETRTSVPCCSTSEWPQLGGCFFQPYPRQLCYAVI